MRPTRILAAGLLLAALPAVGLGEARAASPGSFFRFGYGVDVSRDVDFADRDCAATAPPALFGCGEGGDGRALGARGELDRAALLDVGVGWDGGLWRLELLASRRTPRDYAGAANFLAVDPAQQPVAARVDGTSLLLQGTLDLAALGGHDAARWRPYLTLAAGVARNTVDAMHYDFPTLGAAATTRVPDGRWEGFAAAAGAGVSRAFGRFALDLGWRYADLGEIATARGTATIVRASRPQPLRLEIAPTRADWRGHEFTASVRWSF